jgi:hypothetical protein
MVAGHGCDRLLYWDALLSNRCCCNVVTMLQVLGVIVYSVAKGEFSFIFYTTINFTLVGVVHGALPSLTANPFSNQP